MDSIYKNLCLIVILFCFVFLLQNNTQTQSWGWGQLVCQLYQYLSSGVRRDSKLIFLL